MSDQNLANTAQVDCFFGDTLHVRFVLSFDRLRLRDPKRSSLPHMANVLYVSDISVHLHVSEVNSRHLPCHIPSLLLFHSTFLYLHNTFSSLYPQLLGLDCPRVQGQKIIHDLLARLFKRGNN